MNVLASVTTNCIDSTFVVSIVGSYTSDSTPFATVYQTFELRPYAVPTQSLRARSKCDRVPATAGVPGGAADAAGPTASTPSTSAEAAPVTTHRTNGRPRSGFMAGLHDGGV